LFSEATGATRGHARRCPALRSVAAYRKRARRVAIMCSTRSSTSIERRSALSGAGMRRAALDGVAATGATPAPTAQSGQGLISAALSA